MEAICLLQSSDVGFADAVELVVPNRSSVCKSIILDKTLDILLEGGP